MDRMNYRFLATGNEVSEEIRLLEKGYSEWLLESFLTEKQFNKLCQNREMSWEISEENDGYRLLIGYNSDGRFQVIGKPIIVKGQGENAFVDMGLFMLYVANMVDFDNTGRFYDKTKRILSEYRKSV